MFGKLTMAFVVFTASLFGCAKPKYEIVHRTSLENNSDIFLVTDCEVRFRNSSYCLLWMWEKLPSQTEAGIINFKVVRANALDDSPIPVNLNGLVAVVSWMPSMGHGSHPTSVEKVDTGSYRVKNIIFVMPGEWEIKFQVRNGNIVQDEAVVAFTF